MSSRFQEGLEHHEIRIKVFKAQLMSSLFSQPFSTDLCPLYIIIINIISLFINYTYILYTCHCILHHNTSILIQTIQGAPVAAKTLHYCTIIVHMHHYTSLCKQVTQASLSTSRAVIYHPNCSCSAAANKIGLYIYTQKSEFCNLQSYPEQIKRV